MHSANFSKTKTWQGCIFLRLGVHNNCKKQQKEKRQFMQKLYREYAQNVAELDKLLRIDESFDLIKKRLVFALTLLV